MMSSDHGGLEFGHGRWDDVDLLIPMFIKGMWNSYFCICTGKAAVKPGFLVEGIPAIRSDSSHGSDYITNFISLISGSGGQNFEI